MSLDWWFQKQDDVVESNRAEFTGEYRWINAAIEFIFDVQQFVNTDPYVRQRRLEAIGRELVEGGITTLVVNLLNDAMGSLINATRLLTFGAHADAFALLRSAFEACCYAEYYTRCPEVVKAYMEIAGALSRNLALNLATELRKRKLSFRSVYTYLQQQDGENRSDFYARLCNLGAHPSPARIGLRLSRPGGAIHAAVSASTPEWSRTEWTLQCAVHIMAVAKYALEMLFEYYPEWFTFEQSFKERCTSLVREYQAIQR